MIARCLAGKLRHNRRARRALGCGLIVVLILALPAIARESAPFVDITVLENTPDRVLIEYTFGEYSTTGVKIDGKDYSHIALGSESLIKEQGAPALPNICRSVIIPDDASVAVNVLSAEKYEVADIAIAPDKGIILRTIDPASVPYTFGAAYHTDAFYPGDLATLRDPYILRDHRGTVIELNPFQYNPVAQTLQVYTKVTLEVVTTGPAEVNPLHPGTRSRSLSLAFDQLYRHQFLNYEPPLRYDPLDEEGDMLIICHDPWLSNVQPLVAHKNAIGIPTTAVSVSAAGGSSSAIKSYIQGIYDSSDLAFVLLVGDVAQVPTISASGGGSDPSYSKLAGSDDYPEILVGRFSATSPAEVDTQVERTIEYELMPATAQDWFWKGVGIGSSEGAGIGDEGQSDIQHLNEIRGWLMADGWTDVDQIYAPGASASAVSAALNEGRGVLNYTGHGWWEGLSTTGFSVSHVNNLTNENKLSFQCIVACNPGEFDNYGECYGEACLRATHNGEPTGAIGVYASSISQSWAPPMEGQDELNILLSDPSEPYHSFGTLCFAGSCSMMDAYGGGGVSMFDTWIVFGDPSVRVIGAVESAAVKITFPEGLPEYLDPAVENTILVQVEDGGEAYVPGTAMLHYRYDEGGYMTAPLTLIDGVLYEATLPPAMCDAEPSFYFSAEGSEGTTVLSPEEAPTTAYTSIVGTLTILIDDDFESDLGWTVQNDPALFDGEWERGIPVPNPGGVNNAPLEDHDGSGRCYVTGNSWAADVDGGPTYLVSPMLDLSATSNPVLSYARWWMNDDLDGDPFNVEISNDGGTSWALIESVAYTDPDMEPAMEWVERTVFIDDYVAPTAQVLIRFSAADTPNNSRNEGGVDAFLIADVSCSDSPCAKQGDVNLDGLVDGTDISEFIACYMGGDPVSPACVCADVEYDSVFTNDDVAAFVDCLLTGGCS